MSAEQIDSQWKGMQSSYQVVEDQKHKSGDSPMSKGPCNTNIALIMGHRASTRSGSIAGSGIPLQPSPLDTTGNTFNHNLTTSTCSSECNPSRQRSQPAVVDRLEDGDEDGPEQTAPCPATAKKVWRHHSLTMATIGRHVAHSFLCKNDSEIT